MEADKAVITQLLSAAAEGDAVANEQLYNSVYDRLRALAGAQRRRWHGNETLGTTALVSEAYVKLAGRQAYVNRVHFYATASKAMRQILVSYAQAQDAIKRGGDRLRVDFEELNLSVHTEPEEMLDVDRVIRELEAVDPRRGRIVECRLFGGMTVEETAAACDISTATVKREWRLASAWLTKTLCEGRPS